MRTVETMLAEDLAGRYDIGAGVGEGGMSRVFRAQDLKHDRTVAIKVLRPELSESLGAERFLREIRISASLQHPNILPLFDSGSIGQLLYFVMPLIEGETLSARLVREPQLPLDEAVQIALDVADALEYAHEHGVIHRDVKPANIFLTSGHAIVSDFGVAKAIDEATGDEITRTGIAIGTPSYMSPEQAAGGDGLDGRCDVYALGCVLFEMLVGEPPFTGRTPQAVIARHLVEEPPSIEVFRPGIPPGVARVVSKALAKSPADRYRHAAAFRDALRTGSTEDSPAPGRGWSRWMAPLAAAVILVVAGLTWWLSRPSAPETNRNRIVVFPLAEYGLPEEESGAGSTAAFLINTAVEHSAPLRWEDGSRWLSPEQRLEAGLIDPVLARDVSIGRGAGYFIDGEIRQHRDSLTVALRLNDVAGDSTVARESASGPADEGRFVELTLSAMQRVLPHLADPGRSFDLSPLADRDLGAIALFLQGERRYRLSQYDSALALYQRSVEIDSAFAFAAAKGALAARWLHRRDETSRRLLEVAVASDSLLPEKYSRFVEGLSAYYAGQAGLAAERFRAVLEEDPEWVEAWMMLGETHFHMLPPGPRPDSVAVASFERAFELDSGFAPPLYHLVEADVATGDIERARERFETFIQFDPSPHLASQLALALRCASEGSERTGWEDRVEEDLLTVFRAARQLSAALAFPECAASGFEAILRSPQEKDDGVEWGTLFTYQGLLIALGRDSLARAVLDSAEAAGDYGPFYLYLLDDIAGAPVGDRAEEQDAWARQEFGNLYEEFGGPMGLWHLGAWNAHRLRTDQVRAIALHLRQIADSTGSSSARQFAAAMQGHRALVEGDTAAAITAFGGLVSEHPPAEFEYQLAAPLAPERLRLSELLLAARRYDEALETASVFDHPNAVVFLPFIPASLAIRHRAALAAGRTRQAERYRERLEALGRLDLIDERPPIIQSGR